MTERLATQIKTYYTETVRAFLTLIEEKDASIRAHCERVARLCTEFCKRLGLSLPESQRIYLAGLLHDIGLIYVSEEILHKPEPLPDGDMAMIKTHPVLAEKILSPLSFLSGILPIVRHHHERIDGTGYPDGLTGEAIPLGAKVLALADAYDAMISGYPHRDPLSVEAAFAEIQNNAGTQFDARFAGVFIDHIRLLGAAQTAAKRTVAAQQKDAMAATVQEIITRFKDGKLQLPVLPKVVMEIQKVIRNPIATTDDIAKNIEQDAVISLRLITIANSVIYRGVDKVQTVRQAVPRLGIKQTSSIVSTIANKGLYQSSNEVFMDMMGRLWLHSLATAYAARGIGKKLNHEDIEKLYLMGLFHDIGKALLLRGMDILLGKKEAFDPAELMQALQEMHTTFGSFILNSWGFTDDFVRVAKMHNDEKFFPTTQKEILIVNLASMLTRRIGFSMYNQQDLDLQSIESAQLLGLDAAALQEIGEETVKSMQQTSNIF
ncbi:MAG: HDOD domain-containing protein [Desulfobacterota bacterium]|nr:HDOD domain-containing protein [Thermodesulfobacteriota bacterium]